MLETASSPPYYDLDYQKYPEIIQKAAKAAGRGRGIDPKRAPTAHSHQTAGLSRNCESNFGRPRLVHDASHARTFPTQIDMLLNPSHYGEEISTLQLEGNSVEIILSEAMIKHGYLDIPAHAKTLFPQDCFGARARGNTANPLVALWGACGTDRYQNQERTDHQSPQAFQRVVSEGAFGEGGGPDSPDPGE